MNTKDQSIMFLFPDFTANVNYEKEVVAEWSIFLQKKQIRFPLNINLSTGEVDEELNENALSMFPDRYLSIEEYNSTYKDMFFEYGRNKYIKIFPTENITKYKEKAKSIYYTKIIGSSIPHEKLIEIRKASGEKLDVFFKGHLVGAEKETGEPMFIPIYFFPERNIFCVPPGMQKNQKYRTFVEHMNFKTFVPEIKDANMFKGFALSRKEKLCLEESQISFLYKAHGITQQREQLQPSTENKAKKFSKKDLKKEKYDKPSEAILKETEGDRDAIKASYKKWIQAAKNKDYTFMDIKNVKEKCKIEIENIVMESENLLQDNPSKQIEVIHALMYELRQQQYYNRFTDILFMQDDPIWDREKVEEPEYSKEVSAYRNFNAWLFLYAMFDFKKEKIFNHDYDYTQTKNAFPILQYLPRSMPNKIMTINLAAFKRVKHGFMEKEEDGIFTLSTRAKSFLNRSLYNLGKATNKDYKILSAQYDPRTDKFMYSRIEVSPKEDCKIPSTLSVQNEKLIYTKQRKL